MNKAKPDVKIQLDKERTIRFDLNAMCNYEDVTGENIFANALEKLSAKEVRAMLWACLLSEDPSLTLEYVGSLITLDNMAEVAEKLNEAFTIAMPDNGAKENTDNAPLASIG